MPFIDLSSPKNNQNQPQVDTNNNQQAQGNNLNNNDQNPSIQNSLPDQHTNIQSNASTPDPNSVPAQPQQNKDDNQNIKEDNSQKNVNDAHVNDAQKIADDNSNESNVNQLPNMIETKGPPLPNQNSSSNNTDQQGSNIPGANTLPPLNSILGIKDNNASSETEVENQNQNQNQNIAQNNNTIPPMPGSGNPKINNMQSENSINQNNTQTNKPKTNYARIINNFNTQNASMIDYMSYAIGSKASDLHISGDDKPYIRVDGILKVIKGGALSNEKVGQLVDEILDKDQKKKFLEAREYDLSHEHPDGDRFRVNVFFKKGRYSMALRLIPRKIMTISELNLPNIIYEFTKFPQGLVIVTGPTGSGKSTTIAAMIQEININSSKHIITIEDPVEYVYPKMKSLVEQRELGSDTLSWNNALRSALRQAPDVVLVGEMRDFETIESTITVAETGHLVFATLHTNSAAQTIDRIIDVFPEGQQNQVRAQLSNVITAVIAQRLVKVNSGGRKAVMEIMIATPAVKNSIREGKTYQIDNILQTGSDIGMQTLESDLVRLVRAGEITAEEAKQYTLKTDELMTLLKS